MRLLPLAVLLIVTAAAAHGQGPSAEAPRFRVGVDVIRLDAVVTDQAGNHVTDLTLDDFEVRQDGVLQPLTLAQYVDLRRPAPASAALPARRAGGGTAPPHAAPSRLTREGVQRTIVLVIDDLGIAWENLEATRKALRRFVDDDVQPGDLVAVVRTGASWGALQQLTTDRRVLHAAIDEVRWTALSRRGVGPFTPLNAWLPTSGPGNGNIGFGNPDPLDMGQLDELRESMSASASLSALAVAARAVRDLPGRKAIIWVSEGFSLLERRDELGRSVRQPDTRVRDALDALYDRAFRGGAVIYTLDPRGLQSGGLTAEDNTKSLGTSATEAGGTVRRWGLLLSQDTLGAIAEQTGGFAVLNTNDLSGGFTRILEDQRGYYVLGYTPPAGTFAPASRTTRYRSISVKVRRPGLRVRTRRGFVGIEDRERDPVAAISPRQALHEAALSPFGATDVDVRATLLPGYRAGAGASVRAMLHIDTSDLTFAPDERGVGRARVDVLGLVLEETGRPVTGRASQFSITLNADAAQARGAGVVYSLVVPLPRPGGFQVRFAVRDQASGAMGAAGEFVAVPDLSKGTLALSGIVVGEESQAALTPDDDTAAEGHSSHPALRVFRPGSRIVYTYEIYNAPASVESRVAIWRDGRPYFAAPPATLRPRAEGVTAVAGGLRLGEAMPPGDYLLEVTAATRAGAPGNTRSASQWTSFQVRPD